MTLQSASEIIKCHQVLFFGIIVLYSQQLQVAFLKNKRQGIKAV